jgi:tetratricopeptide (TPR) repeat protein
MGFDRHRVMEVFAKPVNGPPRVGSGYRITETAVLTAAHVVMGLPVRSRTAVAAEDRGASRCEVRPLGEVAWMRGSVLWRDESADVALVGLAGGVLLPPPGSPVPHWGVVDGTEPVGCAAVGFPWASEQSDRVRDTEQLIGFAAPLSTAKAGHLSLTALSAAPGSREHGSPWAGMSGAAVFAGPYLVGVVIVDPARFGKDRLVAAAIAPLCADPQFAGLAGVSLPALRSVQPRFRLAVSQQLSVLLQPPYRPLPAGLTFVRAPVRLLLPEYGVVPFLSRGQRLAELQGWCHSPDLFSLRVVTGDGGAGKTRLAAELATQLVTDGWDAGSSDQDSPEGATRLEPDRPMLLIVDDADLKVALVGSLVTTLAAQPSGPPSRLLLLARHMGAWWQQVNRSTGYLAEDFAADIMPLEAGHLSAEEQRSHHATACAAFAAQLGHPESQNPTTPSASSPLLGEDFSNPLLVHMNALLTVLGNTAVVTAGTIKTSPVSSRREQVLERILGRERRRWEAVTAEFGSTVIIQAIAVACLVAPPSRAGLNTALEAIPSLRGPTSLPRERIVDWLHDTYPGDTWVAPLRPDLVTEQLLAETPDLRELVLNAAEHVGTIGQSAHLLNELTRAAPNRDAIYDALAALLRSRLPALLDLAVSNVSSPLPAALELAVRQAPQPRPAAELMSRLPERSMALASLAATIASQAVAAYRELAAAQPDRFRAPLAGSLTNLSRRLNDVGQREEALAAVEEAVAIRRELAAAQPEAFQASLAASLNDQSKRLGDLGQWEEALSVAEEAVAAYRELAAARPSVFLPELADALLLMSVVFAALRRHEDSEASGQEAIVHYRRLADDNPSRYSQGLARALANLGREKREGGVKGPDEAST